MILIVDDRKENILSLQSLLTLHSYPVDTAMSGDEALKKILKNDYALILLDVQMPGMDGFEVAETISGYSKVKDVPIIFLTAVSTDKKFIAKGYSSGAIDYITKPIDPDILLLKVNTLYSLYEQKRKLNEMQAALQLEVDFRKLAQQHANEKAKDLRSILESIPQIAFTTTASGHIEYHNSQWDLYADDNGRLQSHPSDADIAGELAKMATGDKGLELEIRLRKKDQEDYHYHLLKVVPVVENNQILKWTGTFTDIEEQKQAIRKKDEFISMASHEIKTPLTSIQGYVQLLDRMVTDPMMKQFVDRAVIQVKKLDALVSDLLDMSKIESGKLKLSKHDFHFGKMVASTIEMMRQTYSDYTIIHAGEADAMVHADERKLEQVLINFISNAVKYSPDEKYVVVSTEVQADGQVLTTVTDKGVGIPQHEIPHIFDKFYRSEDSVKNFQGLGIGLYICADILTRHECRYGVNSELGKGSSFYFSIAAKNY